MNIWQKFLEFIKTIYNKRGPGRADRMLVVGVFLGMVIVVALEMWLVAYVIMPIINVFVNLIVAVTK